MARVTGVGGVFLRSADPKALGAWYAKHLGVEIGDYGATFWWKEEVPKGTGMTAWNPFPMDTTYFGEGNQAVMINYRVDDLTRSWWISPPPASGSTRNARTRAMVASPGSRTATGTGWSSGSRSRRPRRSVAPGVPRPRAGGLRHRVPSRRKRRRRTPRPPRDGGIGDPNGFVHQAEAGWV